MTDYVLWLIEHPDNGSKSPFYLGWEEGQPGWTGDIKEAFKFQTSEAAEKLAGEVGLTDWRVADHKWLDHMPTSNLDVGMDDPPVSSGIHNRKTEI